MGPIDTHTHAFPDALAGRAIAALEAECPWRAVAGGTIAELLGSMDAAGVDKAVVCPIATKPDQVEGILNWCRQIRSERIIPFPSVHPQTPGAGRWVRRIAEAGFAGLKLHPMYQDFAADEQRMDPIYRAAAEEGLLVTVHCGRDIAYPPDDDRAAPERFARLIERFAGLRLLCTHLGGWRMWDQVEEHLIGKEVYLETSFSLGELGAERASGMIRRHGVEKVFFGTDWPWAGQAEELGRLGRLALTKAEVRAILSDNVLRLLG